MTRGGPGLRLLDTTAPNATILVRLAVGVVFVGEGIQKFLFAMYSVRDASRRSASPRRRSFVGGASFLLWVGAGPWSLDHRISRRNGSSPRSWLRRRDSNP